MKASSTARVVVALLAALPCSAAFAQDPGWSRYTDRDVGVSVDFPTNVFTVDRGPTKKLNGRTFATGDERADVSLYAIPNAGGLSPTTFFRTRFELPSSSVVYQRLTGRILAVSGFRRNKIWYARCNFGSRLVNCVALNYPSAEKRAWDAIVTRISNSLSSPQG